MIKPKLEKISPNVFCSFAVKREITPYMDYPLHFHPEYEIILVEKSSGIRVMGNHIGHFNDGDLVFISPNLPHVWKNDQTYYKNIEGLHVDVYVIHFLEETFGFNFFGLPELSSIRRLFELGKQGVLVPKGKDHAKISGMIKQVYASSGFDRLVTFLLTLHALANVDDYQLLSSQVYAENTMSHSGTERINKVIDYMVNHYSEEVRLGFLAGLINMNKASFCRYFKAVVHKTCTQFLNEIRIANSCKLLVNTDMSVSEICYMSGYNNISHFNRQFKRITGLSAKRYRIQVLSS
jgi:AraC-like DNA-binding protein